MFLQKPINAEQNKSTASHNFYSCWSNRTINLFQILIWNRRGFHRRLILRCDPGKETNLFLNLQIETWIVWALGSVVDPNSFFADPDLGKNINEDPGPDPRTWPTMANRIPQGIFLSFYS